MRQLATTASRPRAGVPAAPAWPRVEAVVVSHDDAAELGVCLRSLANLEYPNLGVTVVDNGGKTGAAAVVQTEYPSAAVIRLPRNVGYAAGNNAALRSTRCAGCEFVWLLNSDSLPHEGALTALVAAAAEPGVGAVGSLLLEADGSDDVQSVGGRISLVTGLSRQIRNRRGAYRPAYLAGASMLVRRRALDGVGLFDERFFLYWEDADLGFRLRKAGWALAVATDSLVWHAGKKAAAPTPEWDRQFNRSAFAFFRHHAPLPVVPIVVGSVLRAAIRCRAGWWRNAAAIGRTLLTELSGRADRGGPPSGR